MLELQWHKQEPVNKKAVSIQREIKKIATYQQQLTGIFEAWYT